MKSMVENRGRWDAGFRSPLLRYYVLLCFIMFYYVFIMNNFVKHHVKQL